VDLVIVYLLCYCFFGGLSSQSSASVNLLFTFHCVAVFVAFLEVHSTLRSPGPGPQRKHL
jgi:hypothetical protein